MSPLRIAAVAALAGAAALALWFGRFDPAARFPLSIDRSGAIQRAAALSRKYGVETAGWAVAATTLKDEKLLRYLGKFAGDPAARLFTPESWAVQFKQPGRTHTVRVTLFADGRPAALQLEGREGEADDLGPTASTDPVADFAGANARSFTMVAGSEPERPAWEWAGGERFPLVARLEVRMRTGRVTSVVLRPRYERDVPQPAFLKWPVAIVAMLEFLGFCVAMFYAGRGWSRGRFTWRMPAAFGIAIVLWTGILVLATRPFDKVALAQNAPPKGNHSGVTVRVDEEDPDVNPANSAGSLLAEGPGGILLLFVFAAAGYTIADARSRRRWVSLELAAQRRFTSREAAGPAAAGALWGVCLAGLPYAIARVFAAPLGSNALSVGAYRIPEAALLSFAAAVPAFGFFGCAEPFAARMKRRWMRIAVTAGVLVVFATPKAPTFQSFAPAAALSTGTLAVSLYLVRRLDLLALACAFVSSHAVYAVATLFAQATPSYRDHAIKALFLVVAAIAAPLYFAVRGRSAADVAARIEEADAVLAGIADASQSSRERLESEFQIARKAQQDALPAAPPIASGLSFAAACEPAQQVGGDLYDFFQLPDGRIGAAVADVSGKGVPAALYMMVTKGLLGAVTRDSSDLRHILESINTHLYRACKRRVFVTMAAVAVDPAKRRVEHGRAGHNPIVWRRARRGETLLVKPGGLGLGMCAGETFARTLRIDAFEMEEGDAVVLYSDGVTEAVNASMEQFGEERLMRSVADADGRSADGIRAAVLGNLAAFCNGTPARDDVTVVAMRVEASA